MAEAQRSNTQPSGGMNRAGKKKRWWLRGLLIAAGLIVLVVALAPTLVSMGVGKGYIESTINDSLNGTAKIDSLSAGWFSGQRVEGLTITDAAGKPAAKLNVKVGSGLLGLVLGTTSKLEVEVSGEAWGELHEDGSISFSELVKKKPQTDREREERARRAGEPASIGGLPDLAVAVNSLTLNVQDVKKNRMMKLHGLSGTAEVAKGGSTSVDLKGTLSGAEAGSGPVSVQARSAGLFDAEGVMRLAEASLSAKVELSNAPMPIDPTLDSMDHLVLSAESAKLAENVKVNVEGTGTVKGGGAEATAVKGALVVGEPVNAKGAVAINLAKVTGGVTARALPTALAQPMFAGTAVDVMRDAGARLDAELVFGEGETKDVHIKINMERIKGEVRAKVDANGAVQGELAHFEASVSPELVLKSAGLEVDKPAEVVADFTQFRIPASKAEGGLALGEISARGTVKVVNDAVVKMDGGETIGAVGPMEIAVESPGLGQWVSVKGGGKVAAGHFETDMKVAGLVGADGKLAAANAMPSGRVVFDGVPGELVQRVGKMKGNVIMEHAMSGQIAGEVVMIDGGGGELKAEASIRTDTVGVQAIAAKNGQELEVKGATVDAKVTPKFFKDYMASLERDAAGAMPTAEAGEAKPMRLLEEATVRGVLEPIKLVRTAEGGYGLPSDKPVVLNLSSVTDVKADRVPGLKEAVNVHGFSARVEATLGAEPRYVVKGTTDLQDGKGKRAAKAEFAIDAKKVNGVVSPTGSGTISVESVTVIEALMGTPAGEWSQWTGESGTVEIESDDTGAGAKEVKLKVDMPNVAGMFSGGMDGQGVWLRGETTKFTAPKGAVEKLLAPSSGEGSASEGKQPAKRSKKKNAEEPSEADEKAMAAPGHLRVTQDVPAQVKITEVRLPMGAVQHAAFDPAMAKMDVLLTAGALGLEHPSGMRSQLSGLTASIQSSGFQSGINVKVKADAAATEMQENGKPGAMKTAGGLDMTGRVTDLMADDSTLDLGGALWQANGKARNIPTALLDAFGNTNGLMTAALGEQVEEVDFKAEDFSATSGTLTLHVKTPNGVAELPLRGKGNAVRNLNKETALTGSLKVTKPLTEKLLQSVHPIFADLRTVKQPVEFTISNLVAPLNGDVSGLKADAAITVGEIELDSGSALLQVIKFAGRQEGTIKGFIEPIKITVRNGVVKYDTFTVKIDKYTMRYTGTVDLVKREVNLKTELPLEALGDTFRELKGISTTVPIVTTGKIGAVKTKIDPDFDIGKAALEAGFKGKLEDLLGGKKEKEEKKP